MKLTFGKYRGSLLRDVNDVQYLTWLYQNADNIDEVSRSKIANRVHNIKKSQNTGKIHLTSESKKFVSVFLNRFDTKLTDWEKSFLSDILNYEWISKKQLERIRIIANKVE